MKNKKDTKKAEKNIDDSVNNLHDDELETIVGGASSIAHWKSQQVSPLRSSQHFIEGSLAMNPLTKPGFHAGVVPPEGSLPITNK